MDFFTVPTITLGFLYCFFMIGQDRRRILHFNVTSHPTSMWIVQQLREAFPFQPTPRFLIFDHDAKYGSEVPAVVRSLRLSPCADLLRKSLAEWCGRAFGSKAADETCWITSFALNERHLKRLLADYFGYYHGDRTHLGLGKGTPDRRICSVAPGRIVS